MGPPRSGNQSAKDEAAEWLTTELAVGPVSATKLKEAAERDGISWRTIGRIKKDINVKSHKTEDGTWILKLPQQ